MAIYTNYGRYLKAKQFKEFLESQGDTYMLLGLGNPQWDLYDGVNNTQKMPIAPYNLSSISSPNSAETNQFYDDHSRACVISASIDRTSGTTEVIDLSSISKNESNYDSGLGGYFEKCKNIVPPFPCIWKNYQNDNRVLLNYQPKDDSDSESITENDYEKYFILLNDNQQYILYKINDGNTGWVDVSAPLEIPTDSIQRQYFAELYLRGQSINKNNYAIDNENYYSMPVGLLGAIKCSVEFVKDLGVDGLNYHGQASQFFYGDRYWEVVSPDDSIFESYIDENSQTQVIYPHHLVITATVNPRDLCADLKIDQSIVARHIALYTKASDSDNKRYYRVDENIFNFGQLSAADVANLRINKSDTLPILNFTLPALATRNDESTRRSDGEFKFLLNDYIKGSVREDSHAIDRFGYVIGF